MPNDNHPKPRKRMGANGRIDCRRCRHYFVTWEPVRPHGCRKMGFKSLTLPSAVVFQSSGTRCQAFERKKTPKRSGTIG